MNMPLNGVLICLTIPGFWHCQLQKSAAKICIVLFIFSLIPCPKHAEHPPKHEIPPNNWNEGYCCEDCISNGLKTGQAIERHAFCWTTHVQQWAQILCLGHTLMLIPSTCWGHILWLHPEFIDFGHLTKIRVSGLHQNNTSLSTELVCFGFPLDHSHPVKTPHTEFVSCLNEFLKDLWRIRSNRGKVLKTPENAFAWPERFQWITQVTITDQPNMYKHSKWW